MSSSILCRSSRSTATDACSCASSANNCLHISISFAFISTRSSRCSSSLTRAFRVFVRRCSVLSRLLFPFELKHLDVRFKGLDETLPSPFLDVIPHL